MPYKSREESIPSDQIEQARGRGVEVGGELGDLVTQAVELSVVDLHGEPPFLLGTLHPDFRATWDAPGRAIGGGARFFRVRHVIADRRAWKDR
jgi:hypothetical protein